MSKFCLISLELLSRGMFDFSNAMEKYISSNSFKLNNSAVEVRNFTASNLQLLITKYKV